MPPKKAPKTKKSSDDKPTKYVWNTSVLLRFWRVKVKKLWK